MIQFDNTNNPITNSVQWSSLTTMLAQNPRQIAHLFRRENQVFADVDGETIQGDWVGTLPGIFPEWIAGRSFVETHGVRYPYVVGAMANGITSTRMVIACATNGILSFFGSAGLDAKTIEKALEEIENRVPQNASWGANLIHAPHEPELEFRTAKLFVEKGVRFVSASAYLKLTEPIVFAAFSGIHLNAQNELVRPRSIFAKISRPETAAAFMNPPPTALLEKLFTAGLLTQTEVNLATNCSIATDVIVESDSGGHTDNQSLGALFPRIAALKNQLNSQVRIGAAGGLGAPRAIAAAFSLGADFVLTGSVNQTTLESGLSDYGKALLATADIGDVMMAPAADMFEMGVKLQVLKRGTMFGVRAQRLWEAYQSYDNFDVMPDSIRVKLETEVLGDSVEKIWTLCQEFFADRDPGQLVKAASTPRHQMALVFRWYLGKSSRWAIAGTSDRTLDFQIWCGPAIAAFNTWTKGSFLEKPSGRDVVQIAKNLMEGATVILRANQLRQVGLDLSPDAWQYSPRSLE